MPIAIGDVLLSRYRAESLRGRGGMGEVWACADLEERRKVAVKVVLPELVAEPWVRRLFQAEVVAVARLSHPGVVEVYDLLALPDGSSLLVMDFRPGRPLDEALGRGRTWDEVSQVLVQLLETLAHAHARSVLHLDLKPPNVLVERSPTLRTTLVDFGIARILRPGRGAESWFEDGSSLGTPDYMSPEQWFGDVARLGPWSDLYSLGVLAYVLCAGHLPHADGNRETLQVTQRRLMDPAPPLQPVIEGVPSDFVDLCAQLLELDPAKRPQCAADVLGAFAAMGTRVAPTIPPRPEAAQAGGEASRTGPGNDLPKRRGDTVPTARSVSGRVPQGSARWRVGDEAEAAFNAEHAPPTPGAYGLFGLRELPVLGRVDERRELWTAVGTAAENHAARAVVLSGPAGTGKSRLARDAVERALELGLAGELHTHWSAGGSPDEGLRGLVENALGSRGSKGSSFEDRLAFFTSRFPAEGTSFEREAKVLLRPERDAAPDAGLPLRVATDVVVRVATQRPVILRLDDVHWSRGEAAQLVQSLGEQAGGLGICIVATERSHGGATDYLQALDDYAGGAVRLAMNPLGDEAIRGLVRGLLDLDDELADVIARRSEGNPLFASQLVGQLVLERAVERRNGRYVLARSLDVARAVPPDMGAVWRRSVKASGADESDLMALALVRDRVSVEVVHALAGLRGEGFNDSFSRALGAGLVRQEGELFAFAHGLFRDYLIARIQGERATHLHGIAADALRVLVGREDVEEAIALHLRAAGRDDEAMRAMFSAAIWSWRRAERASRERRLMELVAWSRDLPDHRALYARTLAELAQHHAEGGRVDEANATVALLQAALVDASGAVDGDASSAWAAFRESQVQRLQGRVAQGGDLSRGALEHARRAREVEVEALCLAQLGLDAFRKGDYPTARIAYDEGIELMQAAKNRATLAQILMMKAALEQPAEMEVSSREAVEMARDAGALRIEISARQIWTEALFRVGRREEARQETEELSAIAQRRGLRQIVSMVEGVAACWAVLDDDWTAAAKHRDMAAKWGAATGATPERATLAAVDVALALARGDDVVLSETAATLVREGRTYREPHFLEIVGKILAIAPYDTKETLRKLDAADGDA